MPITAVSMVSTICHGTLECHVSKILEGGIKPGGGTGTRKKERDVHLSAFTYHDKRSVNTGMRFDSPVIIHLDRDRAMSELSLCIASNACIMCETLVPAALISKIIVRSDSSVQGSSGAPYSISGSLRCVSLTRCPRWRRD